MVVCALIPRFELVAAAGSRRGLLGRPVAVAPEPGSPQLIGEVSGPAEAFGVRAGIGLGEALSRCPGLELIAADPERAERDWERVLVALEGLGAMVEPARPGEAFFAADGLLGLWGSLERLLARTRDATKGGLRAGAGPTRLCAHVAARRPGRRGGIVPGTAGRAYLAPLETEILAEVPGPLEAREAAELASTLSRLGIHTLGRLAALPDHAVADRLGRPGLLALRMARAEEEPLRPRHPGEQLAERLELPDAASGSQLEHALGLLIDRLLANPRRRGRTIRRLRLEATLAGGGSWHAGAALRSATADHERIGAALRSKLPELPGPASRLGLRAMSIGPPATRQASLAGEGERRRELLGEAVRQARAACGRDAVLRVLPLDEDSSLPERRLALTPFPER